MNALDYITALDTLGAVKIDLRRNEVQVWVKAPNKTETFPDLTTAYDHYFNKSESE